jgi:SpoIID/LytB domain protein
LQRVFHFILGTNFLYLNGTNLHHSLSIERNIPVINVGVLTRTEIHFVLNGRFHSAEIEGTISGTCVAHLSGNIIVIECDGVLLGGQREILLQPMDVSSSFVLKGVTIGVQFHWERREDQRFVGGLKLVRDNDKVAAINVVDIENYLTSVISSEMSAECSLDLLKAHTITARSWLLAQLDKSRSLKSGGHAYQTTFESETERIRWYDREDHALYDVCADDHCQRYQGVTKAYTQRVKQAVDDTCGDVLCHHGVICDARFSKACGGVMELFENTWEPVSHPYLASVVDTESERTSFSIEFRDEANAERWIRSSPEAFCNTQDAALLKKILPSFDQETADFFRWRVEYSQEEIADIIHRKSGVDFGAIVDLKPVERGASARLIKLRIVGTKRTMVIGKELEIRRTLAPSHLYSSAIVCETVGEMNGIPSRFILHGAGWGHGVGLCQVGAAVMGERGYAYETILAHYFPHTEITRLY